MKIGDSVYITHSRYKCMGVIKNILSEDIFTVETSTEIIRVHKSWLVKKLIKNTENPNEKLETRLRDKLISWI